MCHSPLSSLHCHRPCSAFCCGLQSNVSTEKIPVMGGCHETQVTVCVYTQVSQRQADTFGMGTKGAFHLSELTDQTIPVAMIMFLLIKPEGSLIEDLRDSKIPSAVYNAGLYLGGGGGGGEGSGLKRRDKMFTNKARHIFNT